jgi:uncharacterized protein (TIGR04255 family)
MDDPLVPISAEECRAPRVIAPLARSRSMRASDGGTRRPCVPPPSHAAGRVLFVSDGDLTVLQVGLPDYDRPPVVEVVLGVQLRPLQLRAIDLGPLRDIWKDRYPTVVEQPPLPPTSMTDGNSVMPLINFGPSPMMRHWWLSTDEERLLQVQQDRFILNWRRRNPSSAYPRYPELRALFEQHLGEFTRFVAAAQAGIVQVQLGEVTYINDLGLGGDPPALDEALSAWGRVPPHHLGEPEDVRFAEVFPISDMPLDTKMYVSLDPQRRPDGTRTMILTLTVRGGVEGNTAADALRFLDNARAHIVTSFSEITSESMQARWGRK